MITDPGTEGLLRELAPRALAAVARRHGDFAGAGDAVPPLPDAGGGHPPHPGRSGASPRGIATAFLVPEATMAQRVTRAKAKVKASGAPFALPSAEERAERLRLVLHVLYLLFNEGYMTSSAPDLVRTALSREAIRLTREVRTALPDVPGGGRTARADAAHRCPALRAHGSRRRARATR